MEKNRLSESRVGVRKLRDHVSYYEGKPIYVTHWMWNTEVGYFMRFKEEYFHSGYHLYHAVNLKTADPTSLNRYVQTLEPGEPIGPGLLIHDESLFQASQGEWETGSIRPGEIPKVLARIPPEWRLIERVVVSRRFVPVLYDIPEGATWPAAE